MTQQAPHRTSRRSIDGVLLLDKPSGLSSHDALTRAKRLLNAKKAGHTGTLDPLASGLLPLCLGEATKFSQDLLDADKTYEAALKLGIRTTTGDAEGSVLSRREVTCKSDAIDNVLAAFRGSIQQIPPMYSALKHEGRPLYEYARAGQTLKREARAITVYALEVLDCQLPCEPVLTIRVRCSKGTYIRVLAEDIGEALGCGAHLMMLRRTQVGPLLLEQAVSLDTLADADDTARLNRVQPVDALLSSCQAIHLDDLQTQRFLQGQRLRLDRTVSADVFERENGVHPRLRVYAFTGRLLGTARWRAGVLAPERLISIASR